MVHQANKSHKRIRSMVMHRRSYGQGRLTSVCVSYNLRPYDNNTHHIDKLYIFRNQIHDNAAMALDFSMARQPKGR